MVTTRKTSDSKVIAMDEKAGGAVVPPRTLLEEVNSQLMCVLCRGYYIDATTIVECLHSFCRSCIIKHLQVKRYCPVCEMMINSVKPNIKPDKALQDIVYKLVPGLFQREMQRRQAFYASRPGSAASATPEQRGEDTERIIFSPEDVISFSLEYMDLTDHESASSKSSESGNESTPNEAGAPTRRYLQCPAVVNISHLKKFLSVKYDVDATNFFVDILYKRVPLPDYYTLMDIAYIYNWKRNEPMRFFYHISDFSAIRDRFGFFGLKRPGLLGIKNNDPSPSPASPAPSQLTEAGSDASSGTFSPVPDDKAQSEFLHQKVKHSTNEQAVDSPLQDSSSNNDAASSQSSSSVDVEKSEFLNSFELTAKSGVTSGKGCSGSPIKEIATTPAAAPVVVAPLKSTAMDKPEIQSPKKLPIHKSPVSTKMEVDVSPGKRKSASISSEPPVDSKKIKLSPEKKSIDIPATKPPATSDASNKAPKEGDRTPQQKVTVAVSSTSPSKPVYSVATTLATKPLPPSTTQSPNTVKTDNKTAKVLVKPPPITDIANVPRKSLAAPIKSSPVKRKPSDAPSPGQPAHAPRPITVSKPEIKNDTSLNVKNMDNKPRVFANPSFPEKLPPPGTFLTPKVTIPSRVMNKSESGQRQPETKKEVPKPSQPSLVNARPPIKMSPSPKISKPQGDPLKSLFHSCNINIPSSLSITLTDQKEQKANNNPNDNKESNKQSQSISTAQPVAQSQPSVVPPEVHNYIEILKLPDTEVANKASEENSGKTMPNPKTSEGPGPGTGTGTGNGKGPVPNLKPISDTKPSKSVPITKPQTFQQTFLQSLQQLSEKPKYIKTRLDFPKTNASAISKSNEETSSVSTSETSMATTAPAPKPMPMHVSAAKQKPVPMAQPIRKPLPPSVPPPKIPKSDSALDLSTPHTMQSQLGPQQAKALETMQSITNLANRQSFTQRMTSPSQVFSQESFKMSTTTNNASPIRIPIPPPHSKHLKTNTSTQASVSNSPKHFPDYFPSMKISNSRMTNNGSPNQSNKPANSQQQSSYAQRSQTRSPSSSPKLVIACPSPKSQSPEDKQLLSPKGSDSSSQSNLISSSQITSTNHSNNESSSSKEPPKMLKPLKQPAPSKGNNNSRGKASTSGGNPLPQDMMHPIPSIMQQAYIRQQLELQTQLGLLPPGAAAQWYNNPIARAHFENVIKMHSQQMPYSNNHKDNK